MTITLRPDWTSAAQRAIEIAEEVRARAEAAGPAPVILGLSPRRRAAYDRLVDATNRLPRPLMVMGTLALLGSALFAPTWFEGRMEALSDMPEALWWVIGAVLSLHFGARYQDRSQEFQREVAATVVRAAEPAPALPDAAASPGSDAGLVLSTLAAGDNPAIEEWRAQVLARVNTTSPAPVTI